jgi:hypothetical protein
MANKRRNSDSLLTDVILEELPFLGGRRRVKTRKTLRKSKAKKSKKTRSKGRRI